MPPRSSSAAPHAAAVGTGVGALLGLEAAGRATAAMVTALAEGACARAQRDAFEAALYDLWRVEAAAAPLSALSPLHRLMPLLAEGDVVLAAPAWLARHRQAVGELRRVGWTVEAASPEALEARLEAAGAPRHWYVAESAQPREGCVLSLDRLWALHASSARLTLWLDDTHGLGWHGRGGRGLVLEQAPAGARLVVSADLAPALGVELGMIASARPDWLAAIRRSLGEREPAATHLAVGVAVAGELAAVGARTLQARLRKRLQICDRLLKAQRLPQIEVAGLPHRYVAMGEPAAAHALVATLLEAGHPASAASVATPSGPMPAVRLSLSLAQPVEALQGLVEAMAARFEDVLDYAGVDADALRAAHGLGAPTGPGTMVDLNDWRTSRLSGSADSRMRR